MPCLPHPKGGCPRRVPWPSDPCPTGPAPARPGVRLPEVAQGPLLGLVLARDPALSAASGGSSWRRLPRSGSARSPARASTCMRGDRGRRRPLSHARRRGLSTGQVTRGRGRWARSLRPPPPTGCTGRSKPRVRWRLRSSGVGIRAGRLRRGRSSCRRSRRGAALLTATRW